MTRVKNLSAVRSGRFQVTVVVVTLVIHVCTALLVNTICRHALVFNHLAYIPLILAAVWWGRRAVWIALIPGAIPLAISLAGLSPAPLWSECLRAFFYMAFTLLTGIVADRLRASEAMAQKSDLNLRAIIEGSLSGVAVYREQKLLFINNRLIQMLGKTEPDGESTLQGQEGWVGRSIWDFVHPEDREGIESKVRTRQKQVGGGLRYEARLIALDGRVINADIASSAIDFEGQSSVLVSVYDVTQLREAEATRLELSEKTREQEDLLIHSSRLAEMGEMAAAVAHELNQPLTGIRNYAKNAAFMLEEDAGSVGEVKDNLLRISQQVDRAARIIAQMRSLARRAETERVPVQINLVIRETLEFLDSQMRLSGIEVRRDLGEPMPLVPGDRLRLWQVFLNVLVNARQAMEDSEQRLLTVTTRHEPQEALPVIVTFKDTGGGFSQEAGARLFEPFFTTKGPGRGTGLGLSISHAILREHQGQIEATGIPGQGATFTIRLPVCTKEDLGVD